MSRAPKIAIIIAVCVLAAVFVVFVAALLIVRTPWFRNTARDRLISSIDESTGGRAGMSGFEFSPGTLTADITGFVLHGIEPPGAPPLFRAASVRIVLKPSAVLHRRLEVRSLVIEQPEVHVSVAPDGSTNIPKPAKAPATGKEDPLKTALDMAVGEFRATNGLLVFADHKIPLDIRGQNVAARLVYQAAAPRYTGAISLAPAYVKSDANTPLPVNVDVPLEVARDAVTITNARFDAPLSRLSAAARFTDLSPARGSVHLTGRLALPELAASFRPALVRRTAGAPPLDLNAAASVDGNQAQVESLNIAMGRSSLEATGALANLQSFTGTFRFRGDFTMQELKNLLNMPSLGTGTVHVTGTATTGPKGVDVKANFSGQSMTLNAGKARLSGVSISSDLHAVSGRITFTNLRMSALGGMFQGSAEIINNNRFRVDGVLSGIELRQAAAAYGIRPFAWSGAVSGPIHAEGGLRGDVARQLLAAAKLSIAPQPGGIPVSGRIDAAYSGPANNLAFANSFFALPSTRVDFSGAIGNRVNVRAASRNLNDLLPVLALVSATPPRSLPIELAANGEATFAGTVTGTIRDPNIAGGVNLANFVVNRQEFDRFTAALSLSSSGAAIRNAVLTQGQLQARFDGSIGLVDWKPQPASPVSATASVRNAPIASLLALVGRPALPATGVLSADAGVSGSYRDPRAIFELDVVNGSLYGEPFDCAHASAAYYADTLELNSAQVAAPSGRITASGAFRHPPGDFTRGRVEFRVASGALELNRIHAVSAREPGLSGLVEFLADGAGTLSPGATPLPFLLSSLNARVAATSLAINGQPAGGLLLTAGTRGSTVAFALQSDIAGSNLRGNGTWQLSGDYPIHAELTFSPVQLGAIARLASVKGVPQDFAGVIAGTIGVSGPVFRPADLSGTLQLTDLQLRPNTRLQPAYVLRNAGPITATLARSALLLQPARLVGPSTDLTVAGAMYLNKGNALDFRVAGRIGLELAESFNPKVTAGGAVLVDAAVHGTPSKPDVNGRLDLLNASLNVRDFPNGVSHANGVILFSGDQAVIQNITGVTGGGKISIDGTVHYGAPVVDFRVQATANEVRLDYPANVSTKVNAKLALAGTTSSSMLSGNISVLEVFLRTNTDIGSLLAPGGPPPTTPAAQTGMLGGMRLDVRIATAPEIQFFTTLARKVQANGSVQLRGTATQPGAIGRVNVTEGEILFFGYKYTINRGTISFYNPQRIEPILNIDLETKASGITVTIMVSGPADRLKLTYSSDPPLLFNDIVTLLATGRTPTTDPVLAATLPSQPQQSMEQMGASTLLGQAIATPVAGRLQRLFGISQLQISPQIIGTTNIPETQITLQQQISQNFSFTYVQNLSVANPEVIRFEWAIDPRWSAVGVRELDGRFSVDLFYRKTFR